MKAMNKLEAFRKSLKVHPIIIIDNGEQNPKTEEVKNNEMNFEEWEAWAAWNAWEAWTAWNADEHER